MMSIPLFIMFILLSLHNILEMSASVSSYVSLGWTLKDMTARSLFFLCVYVHVTDRFFLTLHADTDTSHLDLCVFGFL